MRWFLIGAQFALGVWLMSLAAELLGWPFVLAMVALVSPMIAMAWKDPDRWGWLLGWSSPRARG